MKVTHVLTAAGWVPLRSWRPYGKHPDRNEFVTFVLDAKHRRFREVLRCSAPLGYEQYLGVWPVRVKE